MVYSKHCTWLCLGLSPTAANIGNKDSKSSNDIGATFADLRVASTFWKWIAGLWCYLVDFDIFFFFFFYSLFG